MLLYVSACPPGTYKSVQGSSVCLPCPSNSNSSVNGSSQCPCLQGYYRAPGSGAESGCIAARKTLLPCAEPMVCVCASLGNSYRYICHLSVLTLCNISLCLPQYLCITHSSPGPPSAPQDLSVSTKNATAVVLSWFQPQDSGGVGVVYIVYYQTVSGSQRMTLANITTTSVTVINLSPGTEYMITVVADNGLPGEEASRSASVTVTTEGVSTSILVVITLFKYMYMYMILRINVYFCIPCTCISPAHTHI